MAKLPLFQQTGLRHGSSLSHVFVHVILRFTMFTTWLKSKQVEKYDSQESYFKHL